MKSIYGVFIGINQYGPNVSHLNGCINDAINAYTLFKDICDSNPGKMELKPKFLLSPREGEEEKISDQGIENNSLPTKSNVIESFSHFNQANPDNADICLLYFSGHGSNAEATKELWHKKPSRQIETLVCYDSRTPNNYDLVDIELSYLIHDVVESTRINGKKVHFLCIFDSCHSAGATRDILSDPEVKNRHIPSKNSKAADLDYFYNYSEWESSGYGKLRDGNFYYNEADHVALAGCREDEESQERTIEGQRQGVFTYSLIKTIQENGLNYDYKSLIQSVSSKSILLNPDQRPALDSNREDLKRNNFLLNENLTYEPFDYLLTRKSGFWAIGIGKNQGIENGAIFDVYHKTIKNLKFLSKAVVQESDETESILKISDPESFENYSENLYARLVYNKFPRIGIYGNGLLTNDLIEETLKSSSKLYIEVIENRELADFEVIRINNKYELRLKGDQYPLFRGESDLDIFISCLNKVGKYYFVKDLGTVDHSKFYEKINLELGIIEQVDLSKKIKLGSEALNKIPPRETFSNPIEAIKIKYTRVGERLLQPAITIKVENVKRIHFGVLHLTETFSIDERCPPEELFIDEKGSYYVPYPFNKKGDRSKIIALKVHDDYKKLGISSIRDYLKVFISNKAFSIKEFTQKGIELFEQNRFAGFEDEDPETGDFFWSINIPIEINRELEPSLKTFSVSNNMLSNSNFESLKAANKMNSVEELLGCRINFPAQVSTDLRFYSKNDHEEISKSADSELNRLIAKNSHNLDQVSDNVFYNRIHGSTNQDDFNTLEIVEDISEQINKENQVEFEFMNIDPKSDSIITYGYDPEHDLTIPFGISDESGKLSLDSLPPATTGSINQKSIGKSIKLLFKKVINTPLSVDHAINVLSVWKIENDTLTSRPVKKDCLKDKSSVLLLIHGIIGNTEAQADYVMNELRAFDHYDAILTYNYENLNTPIQDSAMNLQDMLKNAGVFNNPSSKVTILAHSMGGLVSRYFIEKLEGHKVLNKLIMCGTPNNGSELSKMKASIITYMTWGLNGFSVFHSYLRLFSYILKGIDKLAFKTLNQMRPGSEFLKDLNSKAPQLDQVPEYFLIGGNTKEIKVSDKKDEHFWKFYAKLIATKGKYGLLDLSIFNNMENDMAVTLNSMKSFPFMSKDCVDIYGVDHMNYFSNQAAIEGIDDIIFK